MEKLKYATIALHISAGLYVLLGCACIVLGLTIMLIPSDTQFELSNEGFGFFIFMMVYAFFIFAFAVFVEIIVHYLHKKKYWAWIAGIIIGGMYLPSLFLPLGVLIFIGLLDKNVQDQIKQSRKSAILK